VVIVNGILAFAQQALAWLGTQAAALWNVLSAIAANKPEPARNVIVYTVALVVLVIAIPKIVKLVSK
jgi:hypothetical protein